MFPNKWQIIRSPSKHQIIDTPTGEESQAVYKTTPYLLSFGFESKSSIISLLSKKSSIKEVHRDDYLHYWDEVLVNRNAALSHTYESAIIHYTRGVPDEIEIFEHPHYINRMQFDYYTEIFYYHFSTVKDTIGQILNVYYAIGIDSAKVYVKDILAKIPDKAVTETVTSFLKEPKLATTYRNSFAHHTPINYPDSKSTIKQNANGLNYGSAGHSFVKRSVIKENMDITIYEMAKLLSQLKVLLIS